MRRTLLAIIALAALAAAQPTDFPGYDAALKALDVTNRNLSRWFVIVIVVLILAVLVAAWRIWVYGSRLSEIENMRGVWDKRFNDLSDELMRAKRKTAESEQALAAARSEITALRNTPASGPTEADITRLDNDLVLVRQRLDELDAKTDRLGRDLSAVDTHAGEVAEGLKAVSTVRSQAENALTRAEKTLQYISALDSLRAGDDAFALHDWTAAVAGYSRWLDATDRRDDVDTRLRFRVRHNRAEANLRLKRYNEVLDDAAQIQALPGVGPKAKGAARMLAAVVRLNQGLADDAMKEFVRAYEADAYVAKLVFEDEDIKTWVAAHPNEAGKVMRQLKKLPDLAKKPAPSAPAPAAPAKGKPQTKRPG